MKIKKSFVITCALFCAVVIQLQAQEYSLEESIQFALKNNRQIKADEYIIQHYKQLQKTSWELGKTNIMWMRGNYNSVNTDNNITITQSIPFPTVLSQQSKLSKEQTEGAALQLAVTKNELVYRVKSTYLHLTYLKAQQLLLNSQDSLYAAFSKISALRYQTGETNLLEKTSAETQLLEIQNQRQQNDSDILIYRTQLQALLNSPELPDASQSFRQLPFDDATSFENNPLLLRVKQEIKINQQQKQVERNRFLPDFTIGYFTQSLIGWQRIANDEVFYGKDKRFNGYQVGISLPLWFFPQAGRARAAHYLQSAAEKNFEQQSIELSSQLAQAKQELNKNQNTLAYYENTALKNSVLILQQAQKAFAAGEIGYVEYLQALRQAQGIRSGYLSAINQFNQSVIRIHYITDQK